MTKLERFAFIIHPLDVKRDIGRKYPIARYLPPRVTELLFGLTKPQVVSHITGIKSATGTEAEGWFIVCPMTPRMMLADERRAMDRIIEAGKVAQDTGAKIVGLGAFTSVVGDAGLTIAENLDISVTTGNSYTIATALEAAKQAADLMGIDLPSATAAVIGATGSIGRCCAEVLRREVKDVVLVGRDNERLNELLDQLTATPDEGPTNLHVETNIADALRDADIVVTVSSAIDAIIFPQHLKPGAVVCDVARPRDVSQSVAKEREDVLVIEGGVVQVPGNVEFGFQFGFPPKTSYACMAETMICALDGSYEPFTLGRDITVGQMQRINSLAKQHGFKLAGFRSFERAVSRKEIEAVRNRALKS